MPDENLMKSILDAQKRLQPYIDVAEAARRCIQPFDSAALRVIEQNRGVVEMVRNMSLFDTHALLLKEPEWVRQMREIESRFRLPEIPEISGLMRDIAAGPVAKLLNESFSLQRAIEDMRAPWLEVEQQIRSMTGFTELQSIGRALENIPTFDESLVTALRFDLGDWRDSISWKPEIFVDWEARSAFYESLGFNKALTGFPAPAFEQSLDIAGLRRQPTLVSMYGSPVPVTDEENEGALTRTNTAHDWLLRLETQLRAFIDKEMTKAFGADWPKHRLPNDLYDQWQEKKKKAVEAGKAGNAIDLVR
jgi:hypothetical protein